MSASKRTLKMTNVNFRVANKGQKTYPKNDKCQFQGTFMGRVFIGREQELTQLKDQKGGRSASFIVVRGRRRIGKSRIIEEFSKEFSIKYFFTGLPPTTKHTSQYQRSEFVRQMKQQGLPAMSSEDWGDIFWGLGKACEKGAALIVLDEIAWMGSKDEQFLGKLKVAWDQYFESNPNLILVVASSISSWIDKNILKSTGFFGRIDLTLTLKELPLKDCSKFWGKREQAISPFEKLKVLGVTGGVPKYLDAIDPKKTAEENIQELCFRDSGLLFNEFDKIFHDLFSKRGVIYKEIVQLLSSHPSMTQKEICSVLKKQRGRAVSEYLSDLVTAGFLSEDFTWSLKTGKVSSLRRYRVSDNYLRFYLKVIEPKKREIGLGRYETGSLFNHVNWESLMGLQFENLVIHNRNELFKLLKLERSDSVCDGPYFQTHTKRRAGCQIDYLIQAKGSLYVCEVKFSKNPIGLEVIEEVKAKINALEVPKHMSFRPVLIHAGEVRAEVREADYFDKMIDWGQLIS